MLVPCACGRCNEVYNIAEGSRRFLNRKGYWMAICRHHPRARNGYVPEHVLIKERNLSPGSYLHGIRQQVHHIDGNKMNNDLKNLQILTPRQHYWVHKKQWIKSSKFRTLSRPTYLAVDGEVRDNGALIP